VTRARTVGLLYVATALVFLLVGFLLMLLMRWQLAWPGAPVPAGIAALLGDANAPGGVLLPEFYQQLVAMHGTVMVFLAVVPLATGGLGTLLVTPMIGARDVALPRTALLSYALYAVGGLLMLGSFLVEGGAASSGWTSYPPLAVLATAGQSWWLAGMLATSCGSTLFAVGMIATIIGSRGPGVTLARLPFFVWAQLVSAVLLLLAFPALQAAALFQLMDRIAGSSLFLPSGLVLGGIPLQHYAGGGNPLLWQHLFWFLAHPEVYVLILPAMGIVAEVIRAHTGRPLWGARAMVGAVLVLGVLSMLVWAHHMFLTEMGTVMSDVFQVTTLLVSVPSVIVVGCLVLSLWGQRLKASPALLFAVAFLPMFGIGGLTGLPLGMAASDVSLHDTYYVVGHFHYIVAPGTVFALFAAIYHWAPTVLGCTLSTRLGYWHFWPTVLLMNSIFLPMFVLGLAGVNRRLYDAGAQYALAQGFEGLQQYMTWSALALGVAQLPFLLALVTARRTEALAEAPALPFAQGDDTDVASAQSAGQVAPWLIVAWLVMLVGALLSGWVLLRTGQPEWPHTANPWWLIAGAVLTGASAWFMRQSPAPLAMASLPALAAIAMALRGLSAASEAGHAPSAHNAHALWFTITCTIVVMTVVACGAAIRAGRTPPSAHYVAGLRLLFGTLSLLWVVFSLVFLVG